MNALTLQGLSRLAAPLTVEIDHGDSKMRVRHELAGFGQPQSDDPDFGINLDPNFSPWWKQMPPPDVVQSASTGAQATPPPGQLRSARTGYRESFPVTPSNDERNLPLPSGKPLLRLKGQKFTRVYPHTEIDYSELRPQVFPEIGPTPSGWMAPPRYGDEEARAMNAVVGAPAAYPEDMTTDISGFGSLHEAFMGQIPGMVTSYDQLSTPSGQAATQAVTDQVKQAQAAGASPSEIEKIIQMGAQAAALYLQSRALQKMPTPTPAPAVKPPTSLATALFAPDEPIYKRPLFWVGVAAAVAAGGMALSSSGDSSKKAEAMRNRR
jgi:hypothetical protein